MTEPSPSVVELRPVPERKSLPETAPLVSVLIRSMNRTSLTRALASVAAQTYPRIEVVIVAASGPGHAIVTPNGSRLDYQFIQSDTPLPRAVAANTALHAAKGQYLMLLDDDDTLDANHIEKLVRTLQQFSGHHIAAHTGVRLVNETGEIISLFTQPYNRFDLLASNYIPIHAVLFNRRAVEKGVKFDTHFNRYEDWDFWLQVGTYGDIIFAEGISATYYQHAENSGTQHDNPFASPDFIEIYNKWWPRITNNERSALMQHIWQRSQEVIHLNKAICITDHSATTSFQTLTAALKNAGQRIESLSSENALHEQTIQSLTFKNNTLTNELTKISSTLNKVLQSKSWYLTSPLRRSSTLIMKIRRALITLHQQYRARGVKHCVKKIYEYLVKGGFSGTANRIKELAKPHIVSVTTSGQDTYTEWLKRNEKPLTQVDIDTITGLNQKIKFSILIPTFNSNVDWLTQTIESIRAQSYSNWEICIADDASTSEETLAYLRNLIEDDDRIKIIFSEKNSHISITSNLALSLADGEYCALVDHDDVLHQDALAHIAIAISKNPKAIIIYSDEDKIDENGNRFDPYFKSDWNYDLFLSHNLISHLGVYASSAVRNAGGFREGLEGSQDHDLALRISENLNADQIIHIPKVLYHWRCHLNSTAHSASAKSYAVTAGLRAIQEHLDRKQIKASAALDSQTNSHYRVNYALPNPAPLVSIVIPSRDAAHLIQNCVTSILAKSSYPNFELVFIDNNTSDPVALDEIEKLQKDPRVRVIRDQRAFNYSALCNNGVIHSKGSIIALVNNDVEVISGDWLEQLVSIATQPGVGCVGAKLLYPNDTVQHGGVILGFGGVANHAHLNLHKDSPGYFGLAIKMQSVSAVTGACLVVSKKIYDEVGGLDERNLAVAFNDIDFCLRVQAAGYRNIWTPYAKLYHHESATRGTDTSPDKKARFESEVHYMQARWSSVLTRDKYYNPNLTLYGSPYCLAFQTRAHPLLVGYS